MGKKNDGAEKDRGRARAREIARKKTSEKPVEGGMRRSASRIINGHRKEYRCETIFGSSHSFCYRSGLLIRIGDKNLL